MVTKDTSMTTLQAANLNVFTIKAGLTYRLMQFSYLAKVYNNKLGISQQSAHINCRAITRLSTFRSTDLKNGAKNDIFDSTETIYSNF
jgi:hypothetical protein